MPPGLKDKLYVNGLLNGHVIVGGRHEDALCRGQFREKNLKANENLASQTLAWHT